MYVAVEGCCHGELNKIYETLQYIEAKENIEIGLLLCCGDFQSMRNETDLKCMACPDKYKSIQDFWEYYCGKKTAPYLTLFIGGNHEASNYLQELPYGGWVAPNIYYLGYAGVVNFRGLRIGGMSGIFKQHDYARGHYEKPPYTQQSIRSVYHVRQSEVFKLKQLKQPIDIMMSHDWPNGVVNYGDRDRLLSRKKHFQPDVQSNQLGSLPAWGVLTTLRPKYWFSGHLHVKFAAAINHEPEDDVESSRDKNTITRFLALDKCLPKRDFVQVIDIATPDCPPVTDELTYDAEWLAVLKNTNELMSTSYYSQLLPTQGLTEKWDYSVDQKKIEEVLNCFDNDLSIPLNFHKEDPLVYNPEHRGSGRAVECKINPQTTEFCAKLAINDPIMMLMNSDEGMDASFNTSSWMSEDNDELPSAIISNISVNPDEIELDDSDEDDDKISDKEPLSSSEHQELCDDASAMKEDTTNGKTIPIIPRLAANFSMNLPSPMSSTPIRVTTESKLTETESAPITPSLSNPETDESFEKEAAPVKEAIKEEPVTKKFKRRNASLYASDQQGDDEMS